MASSYAYTSGQTKVVCATLLLADGRYCGNFVAITTAPDGRREIHERTCSGWSPTLQDALTRARVLAEAVYPPTPREPQPATEAAPMVEGIRKPDGNLQNAPAS